MLVAVLGQVERPDLDALFPERVEQEALDGLAVIHRGFMHFPCVSSSPHEWRDALADLRTLASRWLLRSSETLPGVGAPCSPARGARRPPTRTVRQKRARPRRAQRRVLTRRGPRTKCRDFGACRFMRGGAATTEVFGSYPERLPRNDGFSSVVEGGARQAKSALISTGYVASKDSGHPGDIAIARNDLDEATPLPATMATCSLIPARPWPRRSHAR